MKEGGKGKERENSKDEASDGVRKMRRKGREAIVRR